MSASESKNKSDGKPTTEPARPRVNILGVGVSALNLEEATEHVVEACKKKQKGYITVTGVHGIMEAQEDPEFGRILNNAFICTPDGMPTVWVGKARGFRGMDRVYGPDLMLEVMARSPSLKIKHFFYGGANGVGLELKERLEKRYPGLPVVGVYEPPFRPLNASEEAELRARLEACRPDIVWVGLSTPKQERFMVDYLDKLETTLMIGVGAAFDFHAGRVTQAPRWIQRSGLEWAFRIYQEPKRLWRRYFKNNPRFVVRIVLQLLGLKKYSLF